MAAVFGRSDAGTEFPPPSRKRRYQIYVGNVDMEYRIKQESAHLDAMGALCSLTTPNGTPLLERLLQLEQHMDAFEQKLSPQGLAADLRTPSPLSSRFSSPTTLSSLERRCRCAKSVLLETKAKGTLVERIQRLEKRISQHSMDLEKAFSSGRFASSRSELRDAESDHIREDPEHLESPSHSWSKVQETGKSQETYANNLEAVFFPIHKSREFEDILYGIKVPPPPTLPPEKHASTAQEQLTEDASTREMDLELEDKPSPTAEAQADAIPGSSAGANDRCEAETAGKTVNDENAARKLKFGETPASDALTDSALINAPTGALETEHVDEKNEQPSVKPTVELVQTECHIMNDGGVAKDLIHFRSLDEPLGKLETDFVEESFPLPLSENEPNEQSEALALVPEDAMQVSPCRKKEMERNQSFKHIRERIQQFFGLKEADSATKGTSQPHRFGSKETDSATKATSQLATKATTRPDRFGVKETNSATKATSRPDRFGSKETDSATKATSQPTTKATSRPNRFGSKEADSATRGTSRLHSFGSKGTDAATKASSRLHRFGSKETNAATKATSRYHRFCSIETDSNAKPGTSRLHRFGSSIS